MSRMDEAPQQTERSRTWFRPIAYVLLIVAVATCQESPVAPGGPGSADATGVVSESSDAGSGSVAAAFPHWNQNFNFGTDGWYGSETTEPALAWCGNVTWYGDGGGPVLPSRSRGYATVAEEPCSPTTLGTFPDLAGSPWAPGPDLANFSSFWPQSGFAMQLDVYLDPTWTGSAPICMYPLEFPLAEPCNYFALDETAVFTLAASLRELSSDPEHGVFHYFAVPVYGNGSELSIFGSEITREGWYTFEWSFQDEGDGLAVDFELSERRGGLVLSQSLNRFYSPEPTSALNPADLGSGYLWFVSITPGLELPIDEHRMRRR